MAKIGVLPLARPTFDVEFAEEKLADALNSLNQSEHEICGGSTLLLDADSTLAAIEELDSKNLDLVIILQVTFTDASMTIEIAERLKKPMAIWAFPEPKVGGRLRLNSFCGLNLASHALALRGLSFAWLYRKPNFDEMNSALNAMLNGKGFTDPNALEYASCESSAKAQGIVLALKGSKIGCIGSHPDGFDTCRYDKDEVFNFTGVEVEEIGLKDLFELALKFPENSVEDLQTEIEKSIVGLSQVDRDQLKKSLRLKLALEELRQSGKLNAFAIRCWPEMFTEYGGAVCGPVSMMGENRVPCSCEADVYGSLSTLIMQSVANEPAFLVDLVDIDTQENSGVVWHCGQAPMSMADPDCQKTATVHSNRRMPLLFEFPLKPGRITLARLSQARGVHKMIIATGNMERKPLPFSGTSGVFTFDSKAENVLSNVMHSGLEHHMVLAYGDHRKELCEVASAFQIPVLEL